VIDLSLGAGVLSLEISDNGRGMTGADRAKARSFGLRGLQERAATVGGWIDLSSRPGGTHLILSVPLDGVGPSDTVTGADEAEAPDDRAHDPSAWSPL
jgi:glucose-6-phosphate-specific signal transduction histidine kinase